MTPHPLPRPPKHRCQALTSGLAVYRCNLFGQPYPRRDGGTVNLCGIHHHKVARGRSLQIITPRKTA